MKRNANIKAKKSKEAKQALEPNLDVNQRFQESEKEFKITMTNMLKSLIEKADNMQEQMNNVSRQKEILRKNQKEMLEIKNIVREFFKKMSLMGLPADLTATGRR